MKILLWKSGCVGVLSHFKERRGVETTVLTKNDSAIDSVRMVCFWLFWLSLFSFCPCVFFSLTQCQHCNTHALTTSTTYFSLRLCGLNSGARTCQFNPYPRQIPTLEYQHYGSKPNTEKNRPGSSQHHHHHHHHQSTDNLQLNQPHQTELDSALLVGTRLLA